jgi:RNA polymerase sigma-70 factor (ECF subfamily)
MDRSHRGQTQAVSVRLVSQPPPGADKSPEFKDIFAEHAAYVYTALRRLGVRERDLEDLTHDVFVRVFRHLHELDSSRPIKPWLFGFAFRVSGEDRRRLRRHPEDVTDQIDPLDPQPSALEQLLAHERRKLAWSALETLELGRRAVFILHELDGCPIPEVAESLGIPLATAYSRLRLAREDFDKAARRLALRQR